ncbi:MAG: hypothetical protein WAK71_11870 [Streptosporangiaceae bacterium]
MTPTATHAPGAGQETLTNGLELRSIVQDVPFQPAMSEPTAVHLTALGQDTLSRVPARPAPGGGETCQAAPFQSSTSACSGPVAVS